ncbi:MAG: type II toxin-antitoxin system HicB family antitoxin [Candidatus Sungbacteria bacterium]|nr:type II toxin-antitoxin system HicB family antitoxin [Candidatus Sungbacteria bacterium]
MKHLHYHTIFRAEPKGGFTVIVPALPGCITYGKNLHEAKRMARDAIGAYLASLRKHGEAVPSDNESFIASIDFSETSGNRAPSYA